MNQTDQSKPEKRLTRVMTVAHLREPAAADHVKVMFLESARIYQLPRRNPSFDDSLRALHDAKATGRVVQVTLPSLDSDLIEIVRLPK